MSRDDDTSSDVTDGTFDGEHDWSADETPSAVILDAIATLEGGDVVDLPRLFDVVDPDALDQLVMRADGDADRSLTVAFEYAGYDVTVRADGRLRVTPTTDGDGNG